MASPQPPNTGHCYCYPVAWNSGLADRLRRSLDRPVESITAPAQLTPSAVAAIDPSGSSCRIGAT